MSPTTTADKADDKTAAAEPTTRTEDDKPKFFRVRSSFPLDNGRVLFRTISEKRARTWLERHVPRGEEAHLQLPDGSYESYHAERHGPHGEDMEPWQPFDPDSWKPPAEQEPPGDTAWADVEG